MNKQEILKELLKLSQNDVKELIFEYIRHTNQYSEYIKFISDLSSKQQEILNQKLTRTKMVTNAIQIYLDSNININKDNWFVWARYIDVTEDTATETINLIEPKYILEQINKIINSGKIKENEEYKYLIERCKELSFKYRIR